MSAAAGIAAHARNLGEYFPFEPFDGGVGGGLYPKTSDFVHFTGKGNGDFPQGHGLGLDKDGINAETDADPFHATHGVGFLQLVVRQGLDVPGVHDYLRFLGKVE